MEITKETKALSVKTCFRDIGDITSLLFNPHDGNFYGCNSTSKSVTVIQGKKCFQFATFEDNLVPKGIDYYSKGRYFIIVLDGTIPAIYKKPIDGPIVKIVEHALGRDNMLLPTGIAINQTTGDAYISSQNGSIHKLTLAGSLVVLKPSHWGETMARFKNGLQGMLYDQASDHLLVCDAENNKILKMNPTTGDHSVMCNVSQPFQITQSARNEYLVTSPSTFKIFKIIKEGAGYRAKDFAGSGKQGELDGTPSQSRFNSAKGIAVGPICLVSDINCFRAINIEVFRPVGSVSPSSSFSLSSSSSSSPSRGASQQSSRKPLARENESTSLNYLSVSQTPLRQLGTAILSSLSSVTTSTSTTSFAAGVSPPSTSHFPASLVIKKEELSNFEKIGQGSQGVVYKAQWMGQEVIYKEIKSTVLKAGEEKINSDFVKELLVWQRAVHPSCVSLYGIVDATYEFGFIAEYCHNGSLDMKLKEKMVFSGMQSISYAYSLGNALSVLHAKKIAHRDIKSGNIMLDKNMMPKLGDFGTSKLLRTILGTQTSVGSFNYMAPEIIDGGFHGNPLPSDVYSFGVVMHELATSTIVTKRNTPPVQDKPNDFTKEAREMWWDLVKDCTQNDPNARPVMANVVRRLVEIFDEVNGFKCTKHGKSSHQVFISYRAETDKDAFLDVECLTEGEEWEKAFSNGLKKCKLMVPIISEASWAGMNSASTIADNLLKEYEYALGLTENSQKVEMLPWFVGSIPNTSDFLDSSHIHSGLSIRSTLSEMASRKGITKEKKKVDAVAVAIMEKLKKMKGSPSTESKMDIGIVLEGKDKADHTVQVANADIYINELRTAVTDQCDIDFPYKFINASSESPLSTKQEEKTLVSYIMDKEKKRITIRPS